MDKLTRPGWSPFFQQQLSLEEFEACSPARVLEQHRSRLHLADRSVQSWSRRLKDDK